jgi:hypothetical protein
VPVRSSQVRPPVRTVVSQGASRREGSAVIYGKTLANPDKV